jgi:hypothetical protein
MGARFRSPNFNKPQSQTEVYPDRSGGTRGAPFGHPERSALRMNRRKQPLCAESKSLSRAEPREPGDAYLTDAVQVFLVTEDRLCHLSSFGPRLLLSPNSLLAN